MLRIKAIGDSDLVRRPVVALVAGYNAETFCELIDLASVVLDNLCRQSLPIKPSEQIRDHCLANPQARFRRSVSLMRLQDDVRERCESLRNFGFALEYV